MTNLKNLFKSFQKTTKIRGLHFYPLEKKLWSFDRSGKNPKNDVIWKKTTATFKNVFLNFNKMKEDSPIINQT